jgi:all-trans-retinol 13,14-reductase
MARRFDAIVVGSGLGGLTAGALYARAGRRLLVLERNKGFGGAATIYRHGALAIEASLHMVDGLDDDDPKLPLLRSLGLDRDLEFVDIDNFGEMRGPPIGAPLVLPHGVAAALAATTARFPHQAAPLREYFDRITAARAAVTYLAKHQDGRSGWWVRHAPEAVRRLWPLIREGRATVGEVLHDLFGADEAVKLALAGNLLYYHDDPERMLFLDYAIPQASYLLGRGHYIRGGSQALSDRLVSLIREADGVVEAGREADTVIMDGDRVTGVGHRRRDGGDPVIDFAPVVFGNAAPQRLAAMLPQSEQLGFLAPYLRRRLSVSLWTISIGLGCAPREIGVRCYSTFIFPAWMKALADYREAAAIIGEPSGARLPPYAFVDYARIDSGLNETAPFLGSLCGVDRLENWRELDPAGKRLRKERWMDRFIADLDRQFPGFAAAVVHREMATAETMQHYLNTPHGAVYGFAPETLSFTPRTTVKGLWLASAFTGSGGFTGAMLGGAAAARAAIQDCPQPS